jgi:hypothetical protein
LGSNTEDGYFREVSVEVPNYFCDSSRGTHTVMLGSSLYIDEMDLSLDTDGSSLGLSLGGPPIRLKHTSISLRLDEVEHDSDGEPILLICTAIFDDICNTSIGKADPSDVVVVALKNSIQWVPAPSVSIESHVYNLRRNPPAQNCTASSINTNELETPLTPLGSEVQLPSLADWSREFNAQNETIIITSRIEPFIANWEPIEGRHIIIDGVGFFSIQKISKNVDGNAVKSDGSHSPERSLAAYHTANMIEPSRYRAHVLSSSNGNHSLSKDTLLSPLRAGLSRTPLDSPHAQADSETSTTPLMRDLPQLNKYFRMLKVI